MSSDNTTITDQIPVLRERPPVPGLVLAYSAKKACCRPIAFNNRALVIGREDGCDVQLNDPDDAASRRHAEVSIVGEHLVVRDLGSKNGTFVNGGRLSAAQSFPLPAVVRIGGSVLVARADVGDFFGRDTLYRGDSVLGPEMSKVWDEIVKAAVADRALLIHGESGTGKERAARLVHQQGPRVRGTFVAVNCATLDKDLALAQLFGSKKGAFTNASRDQIGLFQEADRGVIFLDEIGELALEVQAMLLRVLEDGIIKPLGGKDTQVDVLVVCATHAHLPTLVAQRRFRADLLMRLVQREVTLLPLRSRLEEIPFLVESFAEAVANKTDAPKPSARLVEACLLYAWPGNLRELASTIERLAAAAVGESTIEPDPTQGVALVAQLPEEARAAATQPTPSPSVPAPSSVQLKSERELKDEAILAAYHANGGNAAAAAKSLGCAVSTVYLARDRARNRAS